MQSDNLAVWRQLERTDPAQTKAFQRPGGFRGTAIKPMYAVQKMTEVFGQCGKGWWTEKPEFQVIGDAVYCTVALCAGPTSLPVYGVGGDILMRRPREGTPYPDDEAFKKAFTDALTNAMKHLGMGADVHMGLFDDSKYVAQARAEHANGSAQSPPPPSAPPHEPAESRADPGATTAAGQDFGESITLAMQSQWTPETVKARGDQIATALRDHGGDLSNLDSVWQLHADDIMTMPAGAQKGLRKVYDEQRDAIERMLA